MLILRTKINNVFFWRGDREGTLPIRGCIHMYTSKSFSFDCCLDIFLRSWQKNLEIMDDVEGKNLSKKRRIPPTNVKVSFPNGKNIFFGYRRRMEQLQNKMNCRVLPLNGVLNEVVDQR